jgi:hypothetical protein
MSASLTSDLVEPAPLESTPAPPTVRHIVCNELNQKVYVEATDGATFVLAPFETRVVKEDEIERFALRRWVDDLRVEDHPVRDELPIAVISMVGFGFWFAIAWGILSAFVGAPGWWIAGWIILGALVLVGGAIDFLRRHGRESGLSSWRIFLNWVRSWGAQQLNLGLSFLIGIVLPAAAIFFAADALDLIDRLRVGGVHNAHDIMLTLIGRIMQLVFVAIASLAPALLFFLFDREHLQTLRNRFLRQIIRFDPAVRTRHDVLTKYHDLMDEAYGRDVQGRILPGRRSPLLLATLLISLGWTFTLLHGDVNIITERGIASLFEPRLSGVSFAFLGAYFYGLNAVLRGYVRKDLRPKTYSTLTVRILVVVVLAWILELFWQDETLYVLAFLTGIVPETALVLVKETLRGRLPFASRLRVLDEEPDPLTKLEGIDLYDRARLFDEGVTNVQSLAEHDVVELMLQTRIPVARILDWVDQAILYLHAGPKSGRNGRDRTLSTLREYGIRTATDLENVFLAAEKRGTEELALLTKLLGTDPASGLPRLQAIRDVIADEEWISHLRCWRTQQNVVPEPVCYRVGDPISPPLPCRQ